MAKKFKVKAQAPKSLLKLRSGDAHAAATKKSVHVYREKDGKKIRCDTDSRGFATPGDRDLTRIVLDASDGFIPLWAPEVTLRWRFKQSSLDAFEDPTGVASAVEDLLSRAIIEWGDAVPIKFSKHNDNFDFQVVVRSREDCDINGCVLASAFFPDAGRHELVIYPTMFEQSEEEQLETICHELGHVFGLRHFFAQVSEAGFPSVIFGTHRKFSIMNYGADSRMTAEDKADLKLLYESAWSGEITKINGTPIRLVKPFSALAAGPEEISAATMGQSVLASYSQPTRMFTKEIHYTRR